MQPKVVRKHFKYKNPNYPSWLVGNTGPMSRMHLKPLNNKLTTKVNSVEFFSENWISLRSLNLIKKWIEFAIYITVANKMHNPVPKRKIEAVNQANINVRFRAYLKNLKCLSDFSSVSVTYKMLPSPIHNCNKGFNKLIRRILFQLFTSMVAWLTC